MTTIIYGNPHGRVYYMHGGKRVYMESGKKSPGMPQGWHESESDELPEIGIHEGEWVYNMLNKYTEHLWNTDSPLFAKTQVMFNSASEYPPKARAAAVNLLLKYIDDDAIYIEPHCNASGNDWSDAQGHKVLYNEAASKFAPMLSRCIDVNKAPDTKERALKLAALSWALDEVNCPAMYAEMFFMTNKYETAIAQKYLGIEGSYLGLQEFHNEVNDD